MVFKAVRLDEITIWVSTDRYKKQSRTPDTLQYLGLGEGVQEIPAKEKLKCSESQMKVSQECDTNWMSVLIIDWVRLRLKIYHWIR